MNNSAEDQFLKAILDSLDLLYRERQSQIAKNIWRVRKMKQELETMVNKQREGK